MGSLTSTYMVLGLIDIISEITEFEWDNNFIDNRLTVFCQYRASKTTCLKDTRFCHLSCEWSQLYHQ